MGILMTSFWMNPSFIVFDIHADVQNTERVMWDTPAVPSSSFLSTPQARFSLVICLLGTRSLRVCGLENCGAGWNSLQNPASDTQWLQIIATTLLGERNTVTVSRRGSSCLPSSFWELEAGDQEFKSDLVSKLKRF